MFDPSSRPRPTRKQEAAKFAELLRELRAKLGLNQPTMARHLGVAARTLSNWELGYWLPPAKIRPHVLLALRDLAPEAATPLAEALGIRYDEKDARRLRGPMRRGASGGPTEAVLRALLDPIVWRAAETLNVRANDLRAFAVDLLLALDERLGGLGAAARAVQKVEAKGRKKRR